jgi:hypothetical protein
LGETVGARRFRAKPPATNRLGSQERGSEPGNS